MSSTPKWEGLKNIKIKDEETSIKNRYYIGYKVWEAFQESKKYIVNHLNPSWQDPKTLPSGFNITSLLVYVREACADFESIASAKDNVRNFKKRKVAKGEVWNDVGHEYFKKKYEEHIVNFRSGVWYPDCWLAFLAYGAPSTYPAPSLYINRDKITGNKRKKPINLSQVCDLTEIKKNSKSPFLHVDSTSDFDDDIDKSLSLLLKPKNKNNFNSYKSDLKAIKKEDDIKIVNNNKSKTIVSKQSSTSSASYKFNTPVVVEESALVKAKKALDDYSSAYKLISEGTFGLDDDDMLESMKEAVQNQAKYYFKLIRQEQEKLMPPSEVSTTIFKVKEENDDSSIASLNTF